MSIVQATDPSLPSRVLTADDSAIGVIPRPQLRVVGQPGKLRYHFVPSGTEVLLTISDLRDGLETAAQLAPETRESLLAQYVIDPDRLVEPRFELRLSTTLSKDVRLPVNLSQRFNRTFAEPLTGLTSATIVEATGIDEPALAVGNRLNVTHAAVRENGGRLLKYQTLVSRAEPGVTEVYWDWLFKNFVAIDRGFAPPAQTFLYGRVTDGAGAGIGGARVKAKPEGGGPTFATVSDAGGYFAIAAALGRKIPSGLWEVTSGNMRRPAILDGGTARVDLAGVDGGAALAMAVEE